MSTELRNILRQQNLRRQAVNVGAENRVLKERNERLAILNALRDQKRRDDIVLSTDFQPLELRRREQRMDGALRTVVAEMVEGLNESNDSKILANLERMREIILKENPSLGMIGKVKNFLKQFLTRLPETGIGDTSLIVRLANTVDGLASNKVVKNDKFIELLRSVGKSKVDDFSPRDLEEFRVLLRVEDDVPIIELKKIIKSALGDKNLDLFLEPVDSSRKEIVELVKEFKSTIGSLSKKEIKDRFFKPAQKANFTREANEAGRDPPNWEEVQRTKDNLEEFLVDDFLRRNELLQRYSLPERKDTMDIGRMKGKLNRYLDLMHSPEERTRLGLRWSNINSLDRASLNELWERYISDSPISDLNHVLNISNTIKPQLSEIRAEVREKERDLEERVRRLREVKTKRAKKEGLDALQKNIDILLDIERELIERGMIPSTGADKDTLRRVREGRRDTDLRRRPRTGDEESEESEAEGPAGLETIYEMYGDEDSEGEDDGGPAGVDALFEDSDEEA